MPEKLRGIGVAALAVLLLVPSTIAAQSAQGAQNADPRGTELETRLTGAQEVPGPGDPDGRGEAEIVLVSDQRRICFELEVANIEPATAAHIHQGASGVAGPVVVTLAPPPTNGESEACVDADAGVIAAIAANPSNYYVNVHNSPYPNGAVRGQLAVDAPDDRDDDDDFDDDDRDDFDDDDQDDWDDD
jgi:hypothetical protein